MCLPAEEMSLRALQPTGTELIRSKLKVTAAPNKPLRGPRATTSTSGDSSHTAGPPREVAFTTAASRVLEARRVAKS